MVLGDNCDITGMTIRNYNKGIALNGATNVRISNFRAMGSNAANEGDPGINAIGGQANKATIENFWIGPNADNTLPLGTGEHGIYLAGATDLSQGDIHVRDGEIYRTGQCGLKIKQYHTVSAYDIQVRNTNYGNAPGLNEEAVFSPSAACGLAT